MVKQNGFTSKNPEESVPRIPEANTTLPQPLASLLPGRFSPVESVGAYKQGSNRDPAGALVSRTGRTQFNAEGSQQILALAGGADNLSKLGIFWAVDQKTEEVAGRLLSTEIAKVTPCRHQRKSGTVIAYLNDVFNEAPALRPTSKKWVSVDIREAPEGYKYIVVQMALALRRNKSSRASSEGTTGAGAKKAAKPTEQAAPSQQPVGEA